MGKAKKEEETAAQRALAEVGRQQLDDFKRRWQPVQQRLARQITQAGSLGSFERRRAATMAKTDTTAAFGRTAEGIDTSSAAAGDFGDSAHKLAIVGANADQATSSGLSTVAADQAVNDQTIQGLSAVTALGRGERAQAVDNMGRVAAISGQQAQADAEASLQSRMGNARLAATAAGAAGLALARKPDPGMGVNNTGTSLRAAEVAADVPQDPGWD